MNNPLQRKADSISPFQLTPMSVFPLCGLADAMKIYSAMSSFVWTSLSFQNNTHIRSIGGDMWATNVFFVSVVLYTFEAPLF